MISLTFVCNLKANVYAIQDGWAQSAKSPAYRERMVYGVLKIVPVLETSSVLLKRDRFSFKRFLYQYKLNILMMQCICPAGYSGLRCERPCPPGKWGESCLYGCICQNNAACDPIDG